MKLELQDESLINIVKNSWRKLAMCMHVPNATKNVDIGMV